MSGDSADSKSICFVRHIADLGASMPVNMHGPV
jgi:hypothetical protein